MKTPIIVAAFMGMSLAFAQESLLEDIPDVTAEVAAAENDDLAIKIDSTVETKDAATLLEEKFDEFRAEKRKTNEQWDWGTPDEKGDIYIKAEWSVDLDATQPEFVKTRWFAFEKAYMRALADYITDTYGKFVGNTISSEFGDDSTDAGNIGEKPSATLSEKIGMLAEVKIDKALAAEGVPESQYKGKDIVAKKELAHDTLTKRMAKRAVHDASGCIPIKTFEAFTDKNYRVGVIIKGGPQCKALAKCFRMKKRPMLVKSGKAWGEICPSEQDMLQEFGVRLYFDETGTPSLISYGQFGTSYTGKNKAMLERFEKQAKHQATMLADSKISEFISSMMDATDDSPEIGIDMQEAISVYSDDTASEDSRVAIVDKYRKSFKATTSMDMSGITTVYGPKMVTHPSGHKVAVVVRRWSFAQVEAIKEMGRLEKEVEKKGAVQSTARPNQATDGSGVRSGATYDF